jgi:hypothetical protein
MSMGERHELMPYILVKQSPLATMTPSCGKTPSGSDHQFSDIEQSEEIHAESDTTICTEPYQSRRIIASGHGHDHGRDRASDCPSLRLHCESCSVHSHYHDPVDK